MKSWIIWIGLGLLLLPVWAGAQEEWEDYTDPDESFSLQHPADWVTELPEGLVGLRLANTEEALARSNANEILESGDIAVQFLLLPRAMFANISNVAIPRDAEPDELSQIFAELLFLEQTDPISGEAIYEFSEAELVELEAFNVGMMRLFNLQIQANAFWLVYEPSPDLFVLFAGLTSQDDPSEESEALFLEMLESLSIEVDAEEIFQILLSLQ